MSSLRLCGKKPRATTKEQHDQTAGLIVENVGVVYETKVFDNIQLYNRAGECLDNQVETPNLNPKRIMHHEHNRPLTMNESAQCKKELSVILADMRRYMRKENIDVENKENLIVAIYEKVKALYNTVYSIKSMKEAMIARGKLQIVNESLKDLGV